MPAAWSSGANGVPAQVALPTAPVRNGNPLLPEHSSVNVTSWRGRALTSSSVSVIGCWTSPPMCRRQVAGSRTGLSIVPYREEPLVGSNPGIQRFPLQLGADHIRDTVWRRLVQPGEDLFSVLSREGVGEAGCPQQGQPRDSCTPSQQ